MRVNVVCLVVAAVIVVTEETTPASDVVHFAAGLIGRPYVWGAEGPNSFDCSGLTQYVFREFGLDLPRRAVNQSRVGDPIGRRMQRGDLVFFADDARRRLVTHVGIYEGSGQMIEASKRAGRVRRSNLNEAFWVDRFMGARRVVAGAERPEVVRDRGEDGDRRADPSSRKRAVRNAAMRALEELAGAWIRRQRR